MSALTNMLKELRERKLWPIAIGLIVALVAVPVLLSKHAPTNLVTAQPTGGVPYSTGTALPAISVKTSEDASKLAGRGRDPFTPQHGTTTATTAVAAPATVASVPSTGVGVGVGGSSSGGGTGGGVTPSVGGGTTSATPTPSSPVAAPVPSTPAPATPAPSGPGSTKPQAPSGLTDTQTYRVSLAVTNAGGGVDTVDPLERLSVLPSPQQPLLVELGVLKGGHQVLFAVEPGAAVGGPASCTPGPIDCEIIALSPGQTEGISKQTPTGTTPVALFSINSISVDQHPTAAAAAKARRAVSEDGRKLIASSPLSAVSLFQYDPSVGAVVDLRNLTVGG